MHIYNRYIKHIEAIFGRVFEVLRSLFLKEDNRPEKIAEIRDFRDQETRELLNASTSNIPENFLPFLAWENNCFYDWLFMGGISPETIVRLKQLRTLEGTAEGLVEAVKLVPAIDGDSVGFEQTGACRGNLTAEIILPEDWNQNLWFYLMYFIRDYKRASLWLTLYLKRTLENKDLFIGAGVVNCVNVTMPAQPLITGGEPLYAGCGIIECLETVFPVQVITI